MPAPLILRMVCLIGVLISGFLYFQIRIHKLRLEENLNLSRAALQTQFSESAKLKSRALRAEALSEQKTSLAEEERSRAIGFQEQLNVLRQRADASEASETRTEEKIQQLQAIHRDLQRENNILKASVPPENWRETITKLQSRILELEAENTTLRSFIPSTALMETKADPLTAPPSPTPPTDAVGRVVRIGPDASFAILNYGRSKGAAEGQILSFRRKNQTIARVSLTNISNDFSVAQILSATNTESSLSVPDIQVGDTAHLNL